MAHSLDRTVSRYQGSINLDPNIRHFLVQYQKAAENRLGSVKIPHKKTRVTRHNLHDVLEAVVYYMLCCVAPEGPQQATGPHGAALLANLRHLAGQLPQVEADEADLASVEAAFGVARCELLTLALSTFHAAAGQMGLHYTVTDDLIPWVRSITSPGVKDACMALNNATDIPPFVTTDVLLRTPMSRYELYLQFDLWYDFIDGIAAAYRHKLRHLKDVLGNLVFYTTQYDVQKLPELLSRTIDVFTSTSSGFSYKLFEPDYINRLVWRIPFDFVQAPHTSTKHMNSIIKAQEILAKSLGKNPLSLDARMGIALSVSYISRPKSVQLFQSAHAKHDPDTENSLTLHFVKILLTTTPEQLLQAFNEAMSWKGHSSTIWTAFIKKLHDLELLNAKRSIQVMEKLTENAENVIISKNMLLYLLIPLHTVENLGQFMENMTPLLIKSNKSILLRKYMAIAYRNLSEKHPNIRAFHEIVPPGKSALAVARSIYGLIAHKTSQIVGTMLNGEVQVDPQHIYAKYQEELADMVPSENCLLALMKAALVRTDPNDENSCFVWNELYAPQVAILEFKNNVLGQKLSRTLENQHAADYDKLFPSDELWRAYITVLHQYNYVSELSELIKWWEDIEFTPSYKTLSLLLQSLPPDFAGRYIKHAQSGGSSWPWPQTV